MDASPVVVKPDILPGFEKFTWPEIPRGPGGIPSTFHLCADLPGWFPVGISRDAGDLPSLPVSPICDTVLVGRSVCRCSCMLAWAGFTWIPESCSTLAPGPGGPFLTERTPSALDCFGHGCSFRRKTYRASDRGIWRSATSSTVSGVDWHSGAGYGAGEVASFLDTGAGY